LGWAASRVEAEMRQIKPPEPLAFDRTRPSVFLAGSIEQGAAEDWQARVVAALVDLDITILNPRRDAWDAGWSQDPAFGPFREQVEWELDAQGAADVIAFYFSPATRAPITLLELGLAAGRRRAVVCCPDGFWRKGNVDIVCDRYGIPRAATLDELAAYIRSGARPD
jgi:hypothetical protein